jgi:hypothetical protein
MAKNGSPTDGQRKDGHRNGALPERSQVQNPISRNWTKRDTDTGCFVDQKSDSTPFKGVRREILFPTEPSTIGHKKIDRAIERVVSRKK